MEEPSFVTVTEAINSLLQRQTLTGVSNLIDQIFSEIKYLEENARHSSPDTKAEECAINLWNWGVAKKSENVITEIEKAKVRHVSCSLVCLCEGPDQSEEILRRNILMAMKTGKNWIDVGKPELASRFLKISLNGLEKLYSLITQRNALEADVNLLKVTVEKDLLKVLAYQCEAAVAVKEFDSAVTTIQRCKDMLLRQPKEAVFLSILCYNFGVQTYEEKTYEQSSFWLSQSYEIGKADMRYSTGHEMQAKILRLLATVYLEWDCKLYQDKALNAISLANEENLHPAGIFLKMKILMSCSVPDDVVSMATTDILLHKLPLDVYLNTVKLLMEHARDCVGFDFLKMICKHFTSSPDVEKALLLQIDLLLNRGKIVLARQKIEDLITGHYTGKELSIQALNYLHAVLWDCAAKSFESKCYSDALEWYNYSLSILSSGQTEPNFSKLQRNRASCFLHLKELFNAREAITEAAKCDPGSIFTHFLLYKIAIQENRDLEALNAVSVMGKMATQADTKKLLYNQNYSAVELLSLAAQIALENNQRKVAMKALEFVVEQSLDPQQVFLSLRCMVRLTLLNEDKDKRVVDTETIMSYLNTAWNLAVNTQDSPPVMRDCFLLSYKLSLFCPCDKTVLVAQKSCLLMAAALDLEMARTTTDHAEQVALLIQSMENTKLCQEVWHNLKSEGDFSGDTTEILLLLYEFEIRAKLNDPKLENVLECVWELPSLDSKILESIASLSMEAPAYYPSVCKKVLQRALSLHKKQDVPDVPKLSKCLHSLINLSLPERPMELEYCDQEEAWKYYQEALLIISTFENYPEMEILWLMTRAWNTGIFLYTLKKYKDTERWCELALHLLRCLGSLKSSYESKMADLYSDILDKLDKAKGAPCEE
ncbi:testis-expressed protein 11 isoform X2 [Hyperolius riggenbachi]|uniref:testis-expressed protein 11 isoform X2 n=1 Tax=Hyperolius riggenbachi TaxID=752182 RepID=UPI0035A295B8